MSFITAMAKRCSLYINRVSHQYCYIDGSTLSSPSVHVWKVAANSAIDVQIQVLVVYVHTYMCQRGLMACKAAAVKRAEEKNILVPAVCSMPGSFDDKMVA